MGEKFFQILQIGKQLVTEFPKFDSNPKNLHGITKERFKAERNFLNYQQLKEN